MQLSGKVALITGGARRIGRAVALRLARAGCNLAIHYNRSERAAQETASQCRALRVEAEFFQFDLEQPDRAPALIEAVQRRFGGLDILVNNAAIFEPNSIDDFDLVAWERALRVNLTAPAALAAAAAPLLRATRGRIVNLCDATTARPMSRRLAYAVSKGGLETLTLALARGLAPEVNVVGVAPGIADWPDEYTESDRAALTARVPLGRAGTPEEIAAAVHYLLSEGDFITGVILPVDGGRRLA